MMIQGRSPPPASSGAALGDGLGSADADALEVADSLGVGVGVAVGSGVGVGGAGVADVAQQPPTLEFVSGPLVHIHDHLRPGHAIHGRHQNLLGNDVPIRG